MVTGSETKGKLFEDVISDFRLRAFLEEMLCMKCFSSCHKPNGDNSTVSFIQFFEVIANVTVNFEQINFKCKTPCQEVAIVGSMNKGVLKNFAKIARKHLCRSLFFNKFADLRPASFLRILRNF